MEGLVANRIKDYKKIDPGQFGNNSCKWRSLLEWTSCILITIWGLY
jgi:hypothetical protein